MPSSKKPDLDESINVAEAHERVDREVAAAAREKRVDDQGSEPITLWLLAICGIVAVIAGGILGAGGRLFAYGDTFPQDYVRSIAPGEDGAGPAPKPVMEAMMAMGQGVYKTCAGCHQSDGKGKSGEIPALADSEWVTGDTQRFAMIILNGLAGPTSTGKAYGNMPAQNVTSPEELAAVMTYIRNSLGNETGDIVTVEMAQAAFDLSKKRGEDAAKAGKPVTGDELSAEYAKNLPGDPIDPATLVDRKTLLPVDAAAP